ncbi:MAG: hypothetical protein WKF35_11135 [Ferruginibacter sp.]
MHLANLIKKELAFRKQEKKNNILSILLEFLNAEPEKDETSMFHLAISKQAKLELKENNERYSL